jgi:hypothetical protein
VTANGRLEVASLSSATQPDPGNLSAKCLVADGAALTTVMDAAETPRADPGRVDPRLARNATPRPRCSFRVPASSSVATPETTAPDEEGPSCPAIGAVLLAVRPEAATYSSRRQRRAERPSRSRTRNSPPGGKPDNERAHPLGDERGAGGRPAPRRTATADQQFVPTARGAGRMSLRSPVRAGNGPSR